MSISHTVTIQRPSFLPKMRHNIQWALAGTDMRDASPERIQYLFDRSLEIGGGSTAQEMVMRAAQIKRGALLVVDERVSKQLEASTVTGSLANLAWPADSLEVRFADPSLPGCLICNAQVFKARHESGEQFGISPAQEPYAMFLFSEDVETESALVLNVPESKWKEYISSQNLLDFDMRKVLPADDTINAEEAEVLRYMATLVIKVLAYSSVPHLAPVLLNTRGERKEAGLHPKHVRKEKTYLVRYLPRIVREPQVRTIPETELEKRHRFFGRAGHVRYYEDDRYTNMKGKWSWMPPISPPDGIQIIYKVRSVGQK